MKLTSQSAQPATDTPSLIELRELRTHFHTDRGVIKAVDGVDLVIHPERTLGVAGESGCGKSVMARTLMGLVPRPPARVSGEVLLQRSGQNVIDLAKLKPGDPRLRNVRGKDIAMIFQEPMTSLNPVYAVGNQIVEAITRHQQVGTKEAWQRATEMLRLVGIPAPEKRAHQYPHQMSGGMRQRVMIAMALSCHPALLIADEPTTALDVTIQAQILKLMKELQARFKMAILFITHDLGVMARMADEIAVMYLGQIVEYGSVRTVFKKHYHPYSEGLLHSIPTPGRRRAKLEPIRGAVPDLRYMPRGCRFADRCAKRMSICDKPPPVLEPEPGHQVRCWLYHPDAETEVPHA